MVAHVCDLKPKTFIHTLGDYHIYANHLDQVKLQLGREPLPAPQMKLNQAIKRLEDFTFDDFELLNYNPHPHISAPVAV
jgi:thymidylate synthase